MRRDRKRPRISQDEIDQANAMRREGARWVDVAMKLGREVSAIWEACKRGRGHTQKIHDWRPEVERVEAHQRGALIADPDILDRPSARQLAAREQAMAREQHLISGA